MLYKSNVTEQKQTVYEQDGVHRIEREQVVGECQSVQRKALTTYQNKEIKVVLEFPQEVNQKVEEEFKNRLKEVYLRKIKFGSMQTEDAALQSASPKTGCRPVENTKEDKEYE